MLDPAWAAAEMNAETVDMFRVVAIIAAYNEEDILEPAIGHLVANGVDVYLIDNHSTDTTVERARGWIGRGLIGIESFPAAAKDAVFAWTEILERKLEVARTLDAHWYIHHDADEFRESPWPDLNLKEAIRWVDKLGYNAVDFRLVNFPPVDDGFRTGMDPKTYFARVEDAFDHIQIKCWKGLPNDLALADGGHDARFESRRVFPVQFILRHYPIRSQTHGSRKVFKERKGRFPEEERRRGWHVQYDSIVDDGHAFLRNPASLQKFDLDCIRLEVQLAARAEPPAAHDVPSASPNCEGVLDRAGPELIVGWAWGGPDQSGAAEVDLWDGPRLLATVKANRFRKDLAAAGKSDGRIGFVFRVPAALRDGRNHWIWANIAGTSQPLHRSPSVLLTEPEAPMTRAAET